MENKSKANKGNKKSKQNKPIDDTDNKDKARDEIKEINKEGNFSFRLVLQYLSPCCNSNVYNLDPIKI